MPIIRQHFQPAWWLKNPHLQTLYPALLRKNPPLQRWRQRLITPDEDFIDLDWHGDSRNPIVILLHGLSGSSASGYIMGLQHALSSLGFCSVAMNFRGCSGEPNRKARSYHSGETEDTHFVYEFIRQHYPHAPMAAVGFSLGGNVLLKWLGEQGSNVTLRAAVAVSVPLVLSECANRLDTGFSRVYRKHLLDELKLYIRNKHRRLTHLGLVAEADRLKQLGDLSDIHSFWQYDDRVVAKLHGYQSAADYYRRASSRPFLSAIKIPTLVIHAEDDPFMTPNVLPNADELSAQVSLEVCKSGGHVGFIACNDTFTPHYWLDSRIPAFLKPHFQPG